MVTSWLCTILFFPARFTYTWRMRICPTHNMKLADNRNDLIDANKHVHNKLSKFIELKWTLISHWQNKRTHICLGNETASYLQMLPSRFPFVHSTWKWGTLLGRSLQTTLMQNGVLPDQARKCPARKYTNLPNVLARHCVIITTFEMSGTGIPRHTIPIYYNACNQLALTWKQCIRTFLCSAQLQPPKICFGVYRR